MVIHIFALFELGCKSIYKVRENYQSGIGLESIEKVLLED